MNDGTSIVVRAPAKLTLTMRITGVRDDGYHLVDAEMVSLDLVDVLTIDPGGKGIAVTGRYAAGVPTDGRNLVAKALQLAGVTAGVTIDKRIPHGGGLGGGSSDAAAVLRWSGIDDPATVVRIGSDVAFCLRGTPARVTGIGEVLTPLPFVEQRFTLVVPPLAVATAAVYRRWDELGGPTGEHGNDLEPAAVAVEPELARWRDRIGETTGVTPRLAGSGATWFVDGEHEDALAAVAGEGVEIVAARSVPRP